MFVFENLISLSSLNCASCSILGCTGGRAKVAHAFVLIDSAAIAFLVNRDILCGVCANDPEHIYKFFWRDMGPLMAQFPDLQDLPQ